MDNAGGKNGSPKVSLPFFETAFRILFPFKQAKANWCLFIWALLCAGVFAWSHLYRSAAIETETRKSQRLLALETELEQLQANLSESMLDQLASESKASLSKVFSNQAEAEEGLMELSRPLAASEWIVALDPLASSAIEEDMPLSKARYELNIKRANYGVRRASKESASIQKVSELLQTARDWPNALDIERFQLLSNGSQLTEVHIGLIATHLSKNEEVFK